MKTDPTTSINSTPGPAAMTLQQWAIAHGQRERVELKPKTTTAIRDTLETTDREPDGRQPSISAEENQTSKKRTALTPNSVSENGGLLDLTG